jgi:hypothetical protein
MTTRGDYPQQPARFKSENYIEQFNEAYSETT